jgi:hypothetical protein
MKKRGPQGRIGRDIVFESCTLPISALVSNGISCRF